MTLSRETVSEWLDYDPDSGEFCWAKSRGRRKAGDIAGYVKSDGYRMISLFGKWEYAHRLAWLVETGAMPEAEIDHINRVRHDNRIANLRVATRSQNQMNMSGVRGCSFRNGKWDAYIKNAGKRTFLGTYGTEAEANAAYRAAAAATRGEFAPKQEALL